MKAYPATQLCVSGDLKPLSPEAVVKSHKEGSSLPPLPAGKNISCVHHNVQCQTEELCQNPSPLIGWKREPTAPPCTTACLDGSDSRWPIQNGRPPTYPTWSGEMVPSGTFLNKMMPAHLCWHSNSEERNPHSWHSFPAGYNGTVATGGTLTACLGDPGY